MQFERNEKHLILITTNYTEPPKYNYAVEAMWGVSFKSEGFKNYIIKARRKRRGRRRRGRKKFR